MSEQQRDNEFDAIWFGLSCIGICDKGDSPQYMRVIAEWRTAGRPAGISRFIMAHTRVAQENVN